MLLLRWKSDNRISGGVQCASWIDTRTISVHHLYCRGARHYSPSRFQPSNVRRRNAALWQPISLRLWLSHCAQDVGAWLLQLKGDKSEIVWFGSHANLQWCQRIHDHGLITHDRGRNRAPSLGATGLRADPNTNVFGATISPYEHFCSRYQIIGTNSRHVRMNATPDWGTVRLSAVNQIHASSNSSKAKQYYHS